MSTEKRGSEKLMSEQGDLCSLTAEELAQVAGGWSGQSEKLINLRDLFPYGIFPPEHFERMGIKVGPVDRVKFVDMPVFKGISNSF